MIRTKTDARPLGTGKKPFVPPGMRVLELRLEPCCYSTTDQGLETGNPRDGEDEGYNWR